MIEFLPQPAREQPPLDSEPYDRWVLPGEIVKAEFHRLPGGYLMRFEGDADFEIFPDEARVVGWPAPGIAPDHFASLYRNAILPLIGDHNGGLFLHGSAVAIGERAVAFIGESGDGKTTLAGAFAKAGHPFLTEDVIDLVPEGGLYWLQPKASGLRLFADSAAFLLGDAPATADSAGKFDVANALALPFCDQPTRLAAIFLLGSDHAADLAITPIPATSVVPQLLPHSFILDVEDKSRLRGHFSRIVTLSETVSCLRLDYRRDYAELPDVIAAVLAHIQE